MKELLLLSLAAMTSFSAFGRVNKTNNTYKGDLKPRLVVLTDIGDCKVEPDDMESAVRLMAYADRFEIEAVMTSTGWNCDPYPEEWAKYLQMVVDAYAKDVPNLMKRSGQKKFNTLGQENGYQKLGYWPSAEYIRSRTMAGSKRAGIGVIGKDNDSDGSDFLIRLADEEDDRPIYVAAWGGANTLSQAIWKVQQERTPAKFRAFVRKFRLYTITDQDMKYDMRMNRAFSSHQWLRREFHSLLQFIWDENTWQLQCELGKQYWDTFKTKIQGKGALGAIYPDYKWGVEGDTPSFFHCMPNGLNDPDDPRQVGWGGVHWWSICPDNCTYSWNSWLDDHKKITEDYFRGFFPDQLNDFAARMQWAHEGSGNVNPVVIVNGEKGIHPIVIEAEAGDNITLDAGKSKDADGDNLTFKWWHQPEAGKCTGKVNIPDASQPKIQLHIGSRQKGESIHLVCEVHDDGPFNLVSYRRVIINVKK